MANMGELNYFPEWDDDTDDETLNEPIIERPSKLTALASAWGFMVGGIVILLRELLQDRKSPNSFVAILALVVCIGGIVIGLIAGFLQYYTTQFIIDKHELRIEYNLIRHRSNKIPFSKVQSVNISQPFAARLLRLAKLTINVGGNSSDLSIAFLQKADAERFREIIMARAKAGSATPSQKDSAAAAPGSLAVYDSGVIDSPESFDASGFAEADGSAAGATTLLETPPRLPQPNLPRLLSVTPGMHDCDQDGTLFRAKSAALWFCALTHHSTLISFFISLVLLAIGHLTGLEAASFSALLPAGYALISALWQRLITQWGFTVSRRDGKIQIEYGATSRSSYTLTPDRIQGVAIFQPLFWRLLGYYEIKLTVLGFSLADLGADSSNVLLPAGRKADVEALLETIWPGNTVESIERHPVSRRARFFRPVSWKRYRYGYDDTFAVTESGLINHRVAVIPLVRIQSLNLAQGPLDRLADVWEVYLCISLGAVSGHIKFVDSARASQLAEELTRRSRAARDAAEAYRRSAFDSTTNTPELAGAGSTDATCEDTTAPSESSCDQTGTIPAEISKPDHPSPPVS